MTNHLTKLFPHVIKTSKQLAMCSLHIPSSSLNFHPYLLFHISHNNNQQWWVALSQYTIQQFSLKPASQ
uniref:Uncharacterized protein n=1 Tax=Helianthus annuus TaxID=4232 RepID=A0A251TJI7_HELAN